MAHYSTFSIVARDPKTGNIAVCGASHWFAYATVVPFIEAGVGAIATQAECNVAYGPNGLELLRKNTPVEKLVKKLIEEDPGKDIRQLLVIDNKGNAAAHTGKKCVKFAIDHIEKNFACGGNMLASQTVIPAMVNFYTKSNLPFVPKLIKTLQEGDKAGGDIRGKRSFGLLVAKGKGTGEFWKDIVYNLRVDDHKEPFKELEILYHVAKSYRYMAKRENAYCEKKNTQKAKEYYEKAYKLYPENPEIMFWFAKLLFDMGKENDSKKLRKKLSQIDAKWDEYWKRVLESEK